MRLRSSQHVNVSCSMASDFHGLLSLRQDFRTDTHPHTHMTRIANIHRSTSQEHKISHDLELLTSRDQAKDHTNHLRGRIRRLREAIFQILPRFDGDDRSGFRGIWRRLMFSAPATYCVAPPWSCQERQKGLQPRQKRLNGDGL